MTDFKELITNFEKKVFNPDITEKEGFDEIWKVISKLSIISQIKEQNPELLTFFKDINATCWSEGEEFQRKRFPNT